MTDVTRILNQIEKGDPARAEELIPLVYDELRKLANAKIANERSDQTLQATALVHEAYIRLTGRSHDDHWDSRGHFFAAAAEAMRRILVDNARRKQSRKHGGELTRVSYNEQVIGQEHSEDVLALNEALELLERKDPQKAKLVKLRYFAGLTTAQAAEALGIGVSTANKYWAYAKVWLRAEIHGLPDNSSSASDSSLSDQH